MKFNNMKHLDPTTVLEIIRMIKWHYDYFDNEYHCQTEEDILVQGPYLKGALYALKELQDDLEEYLPE